MRIIKWIKEALKGNKGVSVNQLSFGYGNTKPKKEYEHYPGFKYKHTSELARSTDKSLLIITANLSEHTVNWLNDMVHKRLFSSRSQGIRQALDYFIRNSGDYLEYLEEKYGNDLKIGDKIYKVLREA